MASSQVDSCERPSVRLRAADGRVKQPVLVLNLFVAPLATLAEVAVVRAALPEIRHATHETAVGFHVEGATDITESADRFRRVELPRVEPKMAVGQRPDRADRDAHAARGAERLREVSSVGGAMVASSDRYAPSMAVTPITSSQTRVHRLHMMQRSHL